MKFKKVVMPAVAICMTVGLTMLSAACGDEPDTPTPPADSTVNYTVTIDSDGNAPLSGLGVLFYSSENKENSTLTTIKDNKATAELPEGNYVVYLTGILGGYIYSPVSLNKTQTTGIISLDAVEADAEGNVAYQVLYMLDSTTILEGDPDLHIGQMCTLSGDNPACYTIAFDEYHMATLNGIGEQFTLPKGTYEIHAPTKSLIPEGYTFDETAFQSPDQGGFRSVTLTKA